MISLAALLAWNRHAFLLDDLTQKHLCTYLCVDKQFFIGRISSFFIKWKPDDETPADCCPQTACSRWRRHEIFEYFRTQGQCVSSRPGCWPMNTIWRHSTPSVRMQVDARGDSLLIDWGLKSFWKKRLHSKPNSGKMNKSFLIFVVLLSITLVVILFYRFGVPFCPNLNQNFCQINFIFKIQIALVIKTRWRTWWGWSC